MPFLLISAIGMTFVIMSGGIDLSVGGVVALTTVASAALLRGNGPGPVAGDGPDAGHGHGVRRDDGLFITYLKVQPFIATLAGLWVARGPVLLHQRQRDPDPQPPATRSSAGTKLLIPGLADPVTKQEHFVSILVVVGW